MKNKNKLLFILPFAMLTISSCNKSSNSNSEEKPSWNADLVELLTEYAPKLDLPYFYFGDSYNSFFNDAYGSVTVSTDYVSENLFIEASDSFNNDDVSWNETDMSNDDGYPSFVFTSKHDNYVYEVDLYSKDDYSRMDIYCYAYYQDDIKDYLEGVNASRDVEYNHYSQTYEESSFLYSALELVGDHEDAKVVLENGDILRAGELDYESVITTVGTRYDNCVYNAVGHEYKRNAGSSIPAYDSDYRINSYLNSEGLYEAKWFEDYLGGGEYKNRELCFDKSNWDLYKTYNKCSTDKDLFSLLLNVGQMAKYIEDENIFKVLYGDNMVTTVTKNNDGTTTCRYSITINQTWIDSFGAYGIESFPNLTKDMDAPFVDTYVREAIFDSNNMLSSITTLETQTVLASQVTNSNSPWYNKEDFVLFRLYDHEECSIIDAGNFTDDLLFDFDSDTNIQLGENIVGCYEYIYGTECTFVAPEDGTYVFKTEDNRCQLDFYTNRNEYIDSCFKNQDFEVTLKKNEIINFNAYFMNLPGDYLFIGEVSFIIEKI